MNTLQRILLAARLWLPHPEQEPISSHDTTAVYNSISIS